MRRLLITLCVGGAMVAAAAPAFAQDYSADSAQRESVLRDRIAEGVNRGELSYNQGAQLRSELRQIVNLDARYQDEGMSDWQAHDIDSRLSLLDSRLNYDLSMSRGEGDFGD